MCLTIIPLFVPFMELARSKVERLGFRVRKGKALLSLLCSLIVKLDNLID